MLRPLGNRVVIRRAEPLQYTESGLVIPLNAQEKTTKGEVIAVGEGEILDNGQRRVPDVKEGDKVLFSKYGGVDVEVDGEELVVMTEAEILCVLE